MEKENLPWEGRFLETSIIIGILKTRLGKKRSLLITSLDVKGRKRLGWGIQSFLGDGDWRVTGAIAGRWMGDWFTLND